MLGCTHVQSNLILLEGRRSSPAQHSLQRAAVEPELRRGICCCCFLSKGLFITCSAPPTKHRHGRRLGHRKPPSHQLIALGTNLLVLRPPILAAVLLMNTQGCRAVVYVSLRLRRPATNAQCPCRSHTVSLQVPHSCGRTVPLGEEESRRTVLGNCKSCKRCQLEQSCVK